MHLQRILICIFSIIGATSTFLQWIEIPFVGGRTGADLNGWFSFGLYLVALVIAMLPLHPVQLKSSQLFGVAICSILASFSVIWEMMHLYEEYGALVNNPLSKAFDITVEYNGGLYVAMICGFINIAFVFFLRSSKPSSR